MVFSVAQSLNPKFPKLQKLVGAPKTFGNFGFPCVFLDFQQKSKKNTWKFLDFQQKSKKTHGIFGFSAEIQKKHMQIFGFSAEIRKNTCKFLDFQQKSKKNTCKFLDFQQKSKLKLQTLRESRSCNFHANLSASFRRLKFQSGMGSKIQDCPEVCWQNLGSRLKPIEPIEISIGTKIQDPRFPGMTPEQSWILDLGSEPRLKFQSV